VEQAVERVNVVVGTTSVNPRTTTERVLLLAIKSPKLATRQLHSIFCQKDGVHEYPFS
jgi:hypothetical protein